MNEEQQFEHTRERMREFSTPIEQLEAQREALNAQIVAARVAEAAREAELEATRARDRREEARSQLPDTLRETVEFRAEFLKTFQAACIALGAYCRSWERAEQLTNALAVPLLGASAEDRDNLRRCALSSPGEVFNAIRDSGYEPTVSYGWNLSYSVVPLNSKETKQ
jgi:hypothetical protein